MKNTKKIHSSSHSTLGILIGLTLLLGSVATFFSLYAPYMNSKTFVISFGTVTLLLVGLCTYPIAKAKNIARTPLFFGALAYVAAVVIAAIASMDPTLSWLGMPIRATGALLMIVLLMFAYIVGSTMSKERVQKYVFLPISISGVLIAFSVYAERAGWKFLASASNGGVLGNTSYAGTYLIISFFITLYLLFVSEKKKKIFYGILAFLTLFNPIFINFSFSFKNGIFGIVGDARGAAIALVVAAVAGGFVWLATSANRTSKIVGKGSIVGLALISLFLLIQLINPSSGLHKWFVEKASGTRFIYWSIAWQGFQDRPIIGNGPETYIYTYQKHFNPEMYLAENNREVWSDKPHNVYLEILSTSGVVGGLGYLVLLVTLIYSTYGIYKRNNDRLFITMVYSILVAYLINNLLIFDTPTSYLLLFALIGAVLAYSKQEDHAILPFKESQRLMQGIIGVVFLGGLSLIVIPQITKMVRENTDFSVSFNDKIAWYPKTEHSSPYGSGMDLAERSGALYEQQIETNIQSILEQTQANKDVTVALIDSVVNTQEELFAKYPKNVQGLINIGKLESIKMAVQNKTNPDSLQIMIQSANDAIKLSPTNPAGYWLRGQEYTYEQNYDAAFASFESARQLDPAIAESHNNLIRLATYLKDTKKVAFYTQRAMQESQDFRDAGGVK